MSRRAYDAIFASSKLVVLALCVAMLAGVSSTFGQSLSGSSLYLANVSERIDGGHWRWTVFIQGSEAEVAQIACVTYTLHPTFPDPQQRVCETKDLKYPFGLTATGWGTFAIRARIEFKDRRPPVETVHSLTFSGSRQVTTERDTDRGGGDFGFLGFLGTTVADLGDCQAKCLADERCKAYGFDPSGVWGARCWLKDKVPSARSVPGHISGIVQ
jgi:hypothetical protein